MSYGSVCECGHYRTHHDQAGRCCANWKAEQCACEVFREALGLLAAALREAEEW